MTQFSPPPPPPPGSYPSSAHTGYPGDEPPFSAAAIAGFVLSFLGCAGVPAVLGLILGIVGISATRNRQRRGRGLAIAAIPLSIITGASSLFVVAALYFVLTASAVAQALPGMFSADETELARAIPAFRQSMTREFSEAVSEEQLRAWLVRVNEANGRLVGLSRPSFPQTSNESNSQSVLLTGKFVNGQRPVEIELKVAGLSFRIHDIRVGDSSPREVQ